MNDLKEFKIVNSALEVAISRGHNGIVNFLLENGAKLDVQLRLMNAIKSDKLDNFIIANYLLKKNYIEDICKVNALLFACEHGKLQFVKLLVQYGVNVNAKGSINAYSPLHLKCVC